MTRLRLPVVAATLAVASVLALSGCSNFAQQIVPASRDGESGEVTNAGQTDAFSIRLGDCFDEPSADEVYNLTAIPCAQPHDNEVYHLFDLEGGAFPGDAAIDESGTAGCLEAFEEFIGVAYDDSEIYFSYFVPTEDSWRDGDREVICYALQDGQTTTGTLKAAGR